jgi:collagenase-like PrtC family protease
MRIVAPICSPDEVAALADAGADEFYCGLLPPLWRTRTDPAPLSRRAGGNLTSLTALAATARRAHDLGRTLAVAFNAQSYPPERWNALLDLIDSSVEAGADALIVADLGLLTVLAERSMPVRLHLSSVASCHNREAAALAGELGAARVILPRHVTVAETRALCAALPGLEFESFALNDGCVFEEGSCHTLHLPAPLGGPICLDCRGYEYERADGAPLEPAEREALRRNDAQWEHWLWYTFACGFTVTETGLPHGPCGLCAIPALGVAGVRALKIAGREAPLERRRRSVALVAEVRARVRAGEPAAEIREFARALRGRPERCASGYMCYFREPAAVQRAR